MLLTPKLVFFTEPNFLETYPGYDGLNVCALTCGVVSHDRKLGKVTCVQKPQHSGTHLRMVGVSNSPGLEHVAATAHIKNLTTGHEAQNTENKLMRYVVSS